MAQAFNLTAQLQLQAPGNTDQVINQIRRQLKPIGVKVNIQNARDIAQANKSLNSFNKNAQASTKSMNQLNRTLQESARRFSVITIATGSFLALANAFKNSTKEAIAFERELVKIAQVTGKSVGQLKSLADEVTRLGTSLGASSSDLLNVARTLTQAGFAAEDTRAALDILAKTSLGATFDNIQDTTEGAIALLRQFTNEARAAGGDIKFLEQSLDAINAVSKAFAVESSDLISVIRRTGGVFAAAGGEINELIALFTSVRATTRESAETIATGLRTIFTRIQRPETITQLREFGVELQDAQGNFVGAFEAFKRLSAGLKSIDPRTTAFSQIVEDLGGFRQVGKVIPLIQQFTTAQQALTVAQNASGSVAKDAETAQQSLGVQIQKVREQFDALIRKFVDSSAFRSLATGGLELAKAFIRIADSLEPLLPMLITLAGLKLGKGLAPALGSFVGIGKSVSGTGPVTKFATGGIVPGTGNRDTVPAMLTPGEFVIRKSSVNKIGAGNLAAMNEGRARYATGGQVNINPKARKLAVLTRAVDDPPDQNVEPVNLSSSSKNVPNKFLKRMGGAKRLKEAGVESLGFRGPIQISGFDKTKEFSKEEKAIQDQARASIDSLKSVAQNTGSSSTNLQSQSEKLVGSLNTFFGRVFEEFALDVVGAASPGSADFDIKNISGLSDYTQQKISADMIGDIKLNPTPEQIQSMIKKSANAGLYDDSVMKELRRSEKSEDVFGDANYSTKSKKAQKAALGGLIQKYAAGGIIQAKKAGAAILDPEAKNSYAENITVNDVKKEFGRAATGAKFARGKDPFSKRFSATKFDVTTSGLNKETSDKFKATLNDSLVAGLDYAGASLGADLGVGAVTVDKSTKDNFINSLRAAQIGDAFENILSTFNNKGVFDSAVDPNRPFDFPNGLTSPLADNFDGLPKSFIDAKSSAAAASKENLRGKILDQIKDELIADGIYNDSPLFKAPRKKALGGIIQKFAEGGVAEAQKAAYIFDFDDTLGTTEAKGFKDFNNPKFIENALATRYASLAKRRASQGDDIHVLTARYGSKGIIQAIQNFMSKNGIPTKSVMAVGGAFPNEREPGKRPGTTRKLGTASKKAKILSKLAQNYSNITFLDDNAENLLKAGQVEGVKAVEAEESKLFKKYAKGGAASDTVPALLTPGEFVFNKSAAQSIGYNTLNRMNKQGVQGYASGGAVGVQRYATGTGSLGATSAGTVSFKGVSNVEGAVDRLHDVLNKMGVDIQNQVKVLDTFAKELEKGGKVSDALTKSFKGTDVSVKNLTKAKKEEEEASKKAAKADEAEANASGKTAKRIEKWQGALGKAQGISQAAQSFVFAGASVAALASQFSGLEDSTKRAISETAGFYTALIGIVGTLGELVFSIAGTVISSKAFQAAMELNTGAVTKNTIAQNGSSAGGALDAVPGGKGGKAGKVGQLFGKLKGPLTAAVVGITAFVVTLTYFKNKAKALADEAAKAFDTELGKAASGEDYSAGALRQSIENEMVQRQASANAFNAVTVSLGVTTAAAVGVAGTMAGTAAAGAALGASFGSVVPVIGTAIGAILGLAAGIAAAKLGFHLVTEAAKEEAAARQRQVDSILDSVEAINNMARTSNEVSARLNEIRATAGLSEERKLELEIGELQKLSNVTTGSNTLYGQGTQTRIAASAGLTVEQFSSKSNDEITQIFDDLGVEANDATLAITQFKVAGQQAAVSEKNRAKLLSESATIFSSALQNAEMGKSLDELKAGNSDFAEAYKLRAKALKDEALFRKFTAANQLRLAKQGGDKEQIKLAQQVYDSAAESLANYSQLLDEGANAFLAMREAEAAALARQQAAAIAMYNAMIEASKGVEIFKDRLEDQKAQGRALASFSSVATGGLSDVRAASVTSTEITPTFNISKFEKEAQAVIDTLVDPTAIKEAEKIRDRISQAATAYSDVLKLIKETGKLQSEQDIAAAMGLKDLSSIKDLLPVDVFNDAIEEIKKASQDGSITPEDLSPLLDNIKKYGEEGGEAFKLISDANQQYLDNYKTWLGQIEKQQQAELDWRTNLYKLQEDAANSELRARNIINRFLEKDPELRDRSAARARETSRANFELRAAGATSQAGDVNALAAERQRLDLEKKRLDEESKTADKDRQREILVEQAKAEAALKAVNRELGRLSNQSDAVNDIFAEMENNASVIQKEIEERKKLIEVEKRAREQMFSVLEDFVVGGPEDRERLGQAAMGVQAAYATGTLQNQSPEQRRATVGLLDQLSDVELMGGMTGKEIKQELVFRDAIQMGFPPEIAKQIATATSKEQQLIDQVEDLKQKLVDVNTQLLGQLQELNESMRNATVAQQPTNQVGDEPTQNQATGGLVQYRANGGTIFKPKGTDTVPAMLTPGEFVIRKSAVDKVGLGTLQAINNGGDAVGLAKGGVVYRANGSDLPEYSPYYGTDLEKRYKEIDAEAAKARGSSQRSVDIAKGNIKSTGVDESLVDKFSSFFGFASNSQEAVKDSFQERRNAINQRRFGDLLDAGPAKQNGPDIRGLSLRGNKEVQRYENESNTINNVQRAIDDSGIAGVPFVGAAVNAAQSVGYGLRNTDGSLTDDVLHTARNVGVSQINVPGVGRLAGGAVNQTAKMFGRRGAGQVGNSLARSFASQQATGDTRAYLLEQLNLARGGVVYRKQGSKRPEDFLKYNQDGSLRENYSGLHVVSEGSTTISQPLPQSHREYKDLKEEDSIDLTKSKYIENANNASSLMMNPFSNALDQFNADKYVSNAPSFLDKVGDFLSGKPSRQERAKKTIRDQQWQDYLDSKEKEKQRQTKSAASYKEKMKEQSSLMQYAASYDAEITGPQNTNQDELKKDFIQTYKDTQEYQGQLAADILAKKLDIVEDVKDIPKLAYKTKPIVPDFADEMIDASTPARSSRSALPDVSEFDPAAMQEKMEQDALTARLFTSKTPGQVKGTLDPVDAILNKGDKYEEFSKYADIELDALNEEIKNTFNPKYRQELEDKRDRLYSALESGVLTKEAFEKFNVEQDAAKEDRRQESKMSVGRTGRPMTDAQIKQREQQMGGDGRKATLGGASSRTDSDTRIERMEDLVAKERAKGDKADQEKINRIEANIESMVFGSSASRDTPASRKKARLEEQNRSTTKEGERRTPQDKQNRARYERILRTQGKAAAERFAKTAGVNTAGEGLIRSFAGYGRNQMMMGGGYGNQMMGGGYGGYGGYGNQMVPFGYIPGSPYNNMLGRGGYNIPRFDKRMMFGNMARFFANGGAAGGDTVPAMLTPGEFVMSKNAVSKYGTGFMQNLNKGKIQGFNKGGAVQYRQAGGGIMNTMAQAVGLDTSKIEGVFSGFVDNFSSVFDNIMGPFNAVAESLRQMSESFGNFTMQHNVNVEGMISLGGLNVESIKNELSKSIGEMVADEVTKAMDSQNKTFKSN